MVPCQLNPPNPKCIVCAEKPEVKVTLNLQKMTVKALEEKILKGELNMVAPGTSDQNFVKFEELIGNDLLLFYRRC